VTILTGACFIQTLSRSHQPLHAVGKIFNFCKWALLGLYDGKEVLRANFLFRIQMTINPLRLGYTGIWRIK
jgi:hypothetical protein